MRNPTVPILWAATLLVAGFAITKFSPATPAAAPSSAPGESPSSPTFVLGPIQPIPAQIKLDEGKVRLGRRLFEDRRFSKDGTVSCATCHDLAKAGQDGLPVAKGVGGQSGEFNTPTVFNCGFNFRQFWDGRAATLEEQVPGPIHSPSEMGASWELVLGVVKSDAAYLRDFATHYPEGPSAQTVTDAIVTFELSLYTPRSRFDQYLTGQPDALTEDERRGYQLFLSTGCVTCHQGVNLGGNMFQALGKVRNYFEDRGGPTRRDLGRYNVTGLLEDKYHFKVPMLRNIGRTAPYLHDGSIHSLSDVIKVMAKYELGTRLQDTEVELIARFLETLNAPPPASVR